MKWAGAAAFPPAHVKPYVRRDKSDQVDAAAIIQPEGDRRRNSGK
jgi:hypothetical protein